MSIIKKKPKFYRLDEIHKRNAKYNVIIGERSNGKTYSVLELILKKYLNGYTEQGAIIRRWSDDFKRQRGQQMFEGLVTNGILNGTEWTGIEYRSGQWTLYRFDEDLDRKVMDEKPFCFSFSLNTMEHDKSTSYSNVTTILFDEFLTRRQYLMDEFTLFMNTLSTIIRYRDNVTIYMCANTVNKSAPYFSEMGLKHINKMQPDTIDVYTYGDGEDALRVAVEYCGASETSKERKPSDVYFAFDNPKLQMITNGAWEVNIYPHLPKHYKPCNVKKEFFIMWEDEILHCEIIKFDKYDFMYIHKKTTAIKDEDKDLIFSTLPDARKNWRRNILNDFDELGTVIKSYFVKDKVYYQDNEIGEVVRNYLTYCKQFSIIKA